MTTRNMTSSTARRRAAATTEQLQADDVVRVTGTDSVQPVPGG